MYDHLQRRSVYAIANPDLSSDIQWLQASLPVKEGGLGLVVRRVTSLAPSSF